ncbi:MAG: hypothetical protein MZV70_48730 [Desulfobacterales bacterium]|nr:hypothetical protein [Desulfobacterales bacterium]
MPDSEYRQRHGSVRRKIAAECRDAPFLSGEGTGGGSLPGAVRRRTAGRSRHPDRRKNGGIASAMVSPMSGRWPSTSAP